MKDILIDAGNEVDIKDGDFVIGESTIQHQALLLSTSKGEWKENPTIAVGAAGFIKDEDFSGLLAEIKKEFEKDGMTVNKISIEENNLNVNADY